jgi:hypothetical protein
MVNEAPTDLMRWINNGSVVRFTRKGGQLNRLIARRCRHNDVISFSTLINQLIQYRFKVTYYNQQTQTQTDNDHDDDDLIGSNHCMQFTSVTVFVNPSRCLTTLYT